jgi:hypothetical protein
LACGSQRSQKPGVWSQEKSKEQSYEW